MARITRINDWSNETSDEIESVSDSIDSVVPRDATTSSARYIIFLRSDEDLTESEIESIESLGFNVRSASDHAIDYENKDSYKMASYIAF